jgi:hypothetical protein
MKWLGLTAGMVCLALSAAAAHAADTEERDISFAALLGASAFNSAGVTNKGFAAGLRWEILPVTGWALGLDWTISPGLPEAANPGQSYNLVTATADVDYRRQLGDAVLWAGPKIGAGVGDSNKKRGGAFAFGAEIGADFFLDPRLSVGSLVEFLSIGSMTIYQTHVSSGDLLEAFLTFKVWL